VTAPRARGQPLAVRLGVVLALGVVVVLLVTGIIVNRVVDRSVVDTLTAAEQARLDLLVTSIEELRATDRPFADRAVQRLLRRMVSVSGGQATLRSAQGDVVASFGRTPANASIVVEPLPAEAGGGSIELRLPSLVPPFLRVFNLALVVGGVASVLAIVVITLVSADRITRPLRALGVAARRLGDGDLAVRAAGGPDRESHELADAFNVMAERLQASERLRRRAASDLAHDLATPATVLESQLQAMVDGIIPAGPGELEQARAGAVALSRLVAQLGELAGAEAAGLQRRPERTAVRGVVEGVLASLDGMLRERRVRTSVEGDADAFVDPTQLERAIRNVIANAIHHSPADSIVEVALRLAGAECVVEVRDRGAGIAPSDLPHVFERFYRADRARGGGGSGLGLTIARELLMANGASIAVADTGPAGTTFVLRLPAA
jgi:signal transduction histidine kinase